MSGTHTLDQSPSFINWAEMRHRTADTLRHVGGGVLGLVNHFEVSMAARSLSDEYARRAGLAALADVDPAFSRAIASRFDSREP